MAAPVNHLGLSPYEASLLGGESGETLASTRRWEIRSDAEGRVEVAFPLPFSAAADTLLVLDNECLARLARLFLDDLMGTGDLLERAPAARAGRT